MNAKEAQSLRVLVAEVLAAIRQGHDPVVPLTHIAMFIDSHENDVDHSNCVVQDWLAKQPLRMQSVLLMATRGPDTHRAPGVKKLTRWLRGLTYVPGNPGNVAEFMLAELPPRIVEKSEIHRELEFVSQHYYSHLMHGLEVVGYCHPDDEIRMHAYWLFKDMCVIFHLDTETIIEFQHRLRQLKWPENASPRTGKEAIELVIKHNALSDRDREVIRRMDAGEVV